MLALILANDIPVTYVRGSKAHVVERAKDLVSKLNKKQTDGLPNKLIELINNKFTFKILHSVEELK